MSLLRPGAGAQRANPLENPSVPLSSHALAEWFGSGTKSLAGVRVTEERALGITAYFRALAMKASTMAAMPLKVYANGTRERVRQPTVLDQPNRLQTPFEFRQTLMANAISWGNGYARKVRNRADVVTSVWPVHPSRVRVELIDGADGLPDKLFIITIDGVEHRRRSWDVMHVPYMAVNGVTGASPLGMARQTLGITIAAEEYAARFFGNGQMPAGILTSDKTFGTDKADELKLRWRSKLAGIEHAHDIAVLDSGAKFTPISIPPDDAQLLATREFQVDEVARLVGVPHVFLDPTKATSFGKGIETLFIAWLQTDLQGWFTNTEQRFTGELLPGGWSAGRWFVEHDINGLLRGDSAARAAFYAMAIQWGWLNRNEVRLLENREVVEGLDEFLTPSNMTLVNVDGTFVPLGGGQAGQEVDD